MSIRNAVTRIKLDAPHGDIGTMVHPSRLSSSLKTGNTDQQLVKTKLAASDVCLWACLIGIGGQSMSGIDKELQQDDEKIERSTSTLIRGLEVLKCFKSENQFLGNKQIAERTGLPKATVSRLSQTLTMMGFLRCLEKGGI